MSRLDIKTPSRAQTVVDNLYHDMEQRIAASPPGLCPVDMALSFLRLCHAQSCGKCVPCRIGLGQLSMLIEQVLDGTAKIMSIESDLGFSLPEGFEGIYITSIAEDCDISKTDLKPKDFITAINGQSVKTYSEFYDTISGMYGAGDTVPATCAHLEKDKEPVYYNIEFRLMEDTSGNY